MDYAEPLFKLKLAIFSNTEEDHKRVYGDSYDSSKNYPRYSGNLQIPESELIKFIDYLQKCKTDPNEYYGEPVVPVKVTLPSAKVIRSVSSVWPISSPLMFTLSITA